MSKKKSYINLLKESISEFDTSKQVDIKGPMLDPILGYDGGGELPTHKDAASVLERYYFNQDRDKGVVVEHEDNVMDEFPGDKDGSSTDADVASQKKDIETAVQEQDEAPDESSEQKKEIEDAIKEQDELNAEDDDDLKDLDEQDELGADDKDEDKKADTEVVENAVIAKLIGEMEEEMATDDKDEEVSESDEGVGGEEAMGTGGREDEVPPRKDMTTESMMRKLYEEVEAEEAEKKEAEEKIDVDKQIASEDAGVGSGPIKAGKGEMGTDDDELEEAFNIFMEEVENDENNDEKNLEDIKEEDEMKDDDDDLKDLDEQDEMKDDDDDDIDIDKIQA